MFVQDEPKIRFSKVSSFNRYIYLVIILHLLLYTFQFNFYEGFVQNLLIITCWVSLGIHSFINEMTRQIVKKSIIATPEVCTALTRLNTALTAILITIVMLCTGNTAFLFLYLVPILNNLFKTSFRSSVMIFSGGVSVFLLASVTGWFSSDLLIVNNDIITLNSLSLISIMSLIAYLSLGLSSNIRHHSETANILHNLATTDALTGLLNRREFNRRISEEIARAKRHKTSLSLALFDIDFFKRINDTYGHIAGDEILKELGELITVNTRSCDISARYGGEEFALILPETTQIEAYELIERLRFLIEHHNFYVSSFTPIQSTISVGVAQYDFMDSCATDFCDRADKALYQAKRNGRNRVECASPGMPKIDLSRVMVRQTDPINRI